MSKQLNITKIMVLFTCDTGSRMERKNGNLLKFNPAVFKIDVQSLPRISKKSTADEKKNLSKHHLILPNNTLICVETLLSQCINEEQTERKFDTKLRARLRKKKVALVKPKNFILKNGKLRPIVTTNIKSGVFRSMCSVDFAIQKKKNSVNLIPANVLYSQSSLPSRIQTVNDFCNDKWITERMTHYDNNDWTRPVAINGSASRDRKNLDTDYAEDKMKPKDWMCRNALRSRNE